MLSGTNDGFENKGIEVSSGAPVAVYGLDNESATSYAFLGLPNAALGTSYTLLAWGSGLGGNSQLTVGGITDGTTVTITPSVDAGPSGEHPAGVPYTITINKDQVYQIRATNNPQDLTGTKITSSAPIQVNGGQQCANIPSNGYYACDAVDEDIPPESAWGQSFLTVPLKTRTGGDTVQFVADTNGTTVSINGSTVATLNAGQSYNQIVMGQSTITANHPILVGQYANSSSFDNTTGDPFFMLIPPTDEFLTNYTITTAPNNSGDPDLTFTNYMNVVVPNSGTGSVSLDGSAVPSSDFTPIGSSGYSGAQIDLSVGSHTVSDGGNPLGVYTYGFAGYNGYGYPGGLGLAAVATVTHVTLTPPTQTQTVGSSACVTATVTDQNNNPVNGARVDFTVSGANTASGSVFTNSSGQAQFCYTGSNTGTDTVKGSVGSVSGTAQVTWTAASTGLPGVMTGQGRMTSNGVNADYAMILGCHPSDPDPRLAVIINGVQYRLASEATNTCTDDPHYTGAIPSAGFNTMQGSGPATASGVTMSWTFVDGGTGGANDLTTLKIVKNGTTIFSAGPAAPGPFEGAGAGQNTAAPAGTGGS
jgi:hypothetical protein